MGVSKIFRVVEVKNNDLFVLYDVECGGVCCCSKYTINQLMQDYGAKIEGVTVTEKGIRAQELGLDGKVRAKKAPIICEDETKRSAATIMRGLDEKHYPRVKQERRGKGSIVKLSYITRRSKQRVEGAMAIQYDNDTFLLEDMGVLLRAAHPELKIENYAATADEIKYMEYINSKYDEKEGLRLEIGKRREEIKKKIEALNKEVSELDERCEKVDASIKKEVREAYLNRKYSGITGDERVRYSFTGRVQGELIPEEAVPYLLKRTKRRLLYTHGLGYRNPTTHNKPITLEQALQVIKENSWFDIDATHDDYIHINTYSDNDMY